MKLSWAAVLVLMVSASCRQPVATSPPATSSDSAVREFVRLNLDNAVWRPAENNTLGVMSTVLEGDPSKQGFYLVVNRFPAGVMSRPHYHPDERHGLVIKGTWYTQEGDVFTTDGAVPLKPGDYMRHPAGGHHFDGALEEEVLVAISGYGPTSATVVDGGPLFGQAPTVK